MTTPSEKNLTKEQRYRLAEYATHLNAEQPNDPSNVAVVRLMRAFVLEANDKDNSKIHDEIKRMGVSIKMERRLRAALSVSADPEAGFANMQGYSEYFQKYIDAAAAARGVSFTEMQPEVDRMIAENLTTVIFDELTQPDADTLSLNQPEQEAAEAKDLGALLTANRKKDDTYAMADGFRRHVAVEILKRFVGRGGDELVQNFGREFLIGKISEMFPSYTASLDAEKLEELKERVLAEFTSSISSGPR